MRKPILFLSAMALSTGITHAAPGTSQTAPGDATARIVVPLTLSHSAGANLGFGKFSVSSSGTVVVAASGAGTATGGVKFVNGSSTTADRFKIVGIPSQSFSVSTGPGTITTPGGASMAFTTTPSVTMSILTVAGVFFLSVGGTLTVPAGQPGGNYSGSYPAVAYYN